MFLMTPRCSSVMTTFKPIFLIALQALRQQSSQSCTPKPKAASTGVKNSRFMSSQIPNKPYYRDKKRQILILHIGYYTKTM